jgi:aminopeptidase N
MNRTAANFLSYEQASIRSQMVINPFYDLMIHLQPNQKNYTGLLKLKFNYLDQKKKLTIDFYQGKISNFVVNGIKINNILYNQYFLDVPNELLKNGENQIEIAFEKEFSQSGSGFYKFIDPIDHKEYFYTDFEPYNANSFMPLFDQPDLKGIYRLTVQAPNYFKVISAAKEQERIAKGEDSVWSFRETKQISSYVFSLHAGPYHEWSDRYKTIPLKLLVRDSLKKFVDHKFWFNITKQGLNYFESYFDYPYPFLKYDQIIVPDFNSGAMENVGAVTFSEKYVRRGQKSLEEEERLANVILHEMSHMWFGNLVTMKWWNGLWLNESFASYMATKALYEATKFKKAWMTFFDDDKAWAYSEDDLTTTHPIEANVATTDDAFNNFDGITYGKGASVLKQLSFFIGEEGFKNGMRNYFKQFEFQNTVLEDFLGSLEKSSGKNLTYWSDLWLKTSGFDRISHKMKCENGKIKEFFIEEISSTNNSHGRFHASKVALFYKNKDNLINLKQVFDVTYQIKTRIEEMENVSCPDFVWLNYDDHDYLRIKLDSDGLNMIKESLSSISNDLTRSQIWSTLWEMVRDGELKITDYLLIVKKHFPRENILKIKLKILESLQPSMLYLDDKGAETAYFENLLQQELKQSVSEDEKKIFYDLLLSFGKTSLAQKFWLQNLNSSKTFLDQDRRWETLIALSRSGYMDYQGLITNELKRDNSENGQKSYLAAQVAYPLKLNKEKWLKALTDPEVKYNLANKKIILKNIFPFNQMELKNQFIYKFYEMIDPILKTEENELIEYFAKKMTPVTCDQYNYSNLDSYLKKSTSMNSILLKALKMNLDEDAKCLKIRGLLK